MLYIPTCMHACIYACMYECLYVSMYVCMYLGAMGWGMKQGWGSFIYVCMHACMHATVCCSEVGLEVLPACTNACRFWEL